MTLNLVRQVIESNLTQTFVPTLVGSIAYENVNFEPTTGQPWLQVFYNYGDGFNTLIGPNSRRETVLTITIFVNCPQAKGSGQALLLATQVLSFFETLPTYFSLSSLALPQLTSLTPRGPRTVTRSSTSNTKQPSNFYTLELSVSLSLLFCSPTLIP